MTVLIIGGITNTGFKLAQLLHDAHIPVLIASRFGVAPDPLQAIYFDWFDTSTFWVPFENNFCIDKIYLIGPPSGNAITIVKPFLDIGIAKGVKKWVIQSGAHTDRGGPFMGGVHSYLHDRGTNYTALRPTWFADNFSRQFLQGIKINNEIVSAAGDGAVAFVRTNDIAEAAFQALTTDLEEFRNTAPFILGPELFTYDDVAAMLTEVLGRKITHKRVSPTEMRAAYLSVGMPQIFADALTGLEALTSTGLECEVFYKNGGPGYKYIGRHKLKEYFEENKELWAAI
ncbi:hypothetical protein BDQ17DRAFT_1072316 [Cyathus striatus]|nr:hypothetical protein BDQ17DRAFT_1072316 [Cyathus striatus]